MKSSERLDRARMVGKRVRGLPMWLYQMVLLSEQRQVWASLESLSDRIRRGLPPGDVDLRLAEHCVFSQNGEDGIIAALLEVLPSTPRHFVEFGTGDGGQCNTRFLAEVQGWSGTYFEPGGAAHRLQTRWENTPRITVRKEPVLPETINAQFESAGVPDEFGMLSIDIDGQDYWVWEALSDRFRPAIVIIEYNALFPIGQAITETRDAIRDPNPSATSGVSLGAVEKLGRAKGYRLVHTDLCAVNAFLVREDLLVASGRELIGITDRSPNYYLRGRGYAGMAGPDTVEV